MKRHDVMAIAALAAVLLCWSTAFAKPPANKRGAETESVEPGAMPRERARIMGYGPEDPRAAADARRNLGGNDQEENEQAELRKKDQRKAEEAMKRH